VDGFDEVYICYVEDVELGFVCAWLAIDVPCAAIRGAPYWFWHDRWGGVMFRAKRDALMGIPRMWRKRRQVQSKRVVSWRAILRVLEKGFG
jgi:hypothetical protein